MKICLSVDFTPMSIFYIRSGDFTKHDSSGDLNFQTTNRLLTLNNVND